MSTMSWKMMTVDEYADFEMANRAVLIRRDGIWWRRVRPFFYRPLFPFERIRTVNAKPPISSYIGGFQHIVPYDDISNSYMNFMVFDDVHSYSLNSLKSGYRKNVKKGMKNFIIRPVDNLGDFMDGGYEAYKSFYKRTKYKWKKERIDRGGFLAWARSLYKSPKLLILGAFNKTGLSAVSVSYLVNDIIMYATFFSNVDSLKLRVSELMLHIIRETAARCKEAKYIYMGMPSKKKSLDEFKISRGCKIFAEPSCLKINPMIYHLTRRFFKRDYIKLIGIQRNEAENELKTIYSGER